MKNKLTTVFVDAGGTFLNLNREIGEIYAALAGELGFTVDPDEMTARFPMAWAASKQRRKASRYKCDDSVLREEWRAIVRDVFPRAIGREDFENIFSHIFGSLGAARFFRIADGFVAVARRLRAGGIGLGVVSNWDSRLSKILKEFGIDDLFDTVTVSWEVGLEKPHPGMFETALERAGVGPGDAAMIGDSFEWDVLPSESLGMTPVWFNPDGSHLEWKGVRLLSWTEPEPLLRLL